MFWKKVLSNINRIATLSPTQRKPMTERQLENNNLRVNSDWRKVKKFTWYIKWKENKITCKVSPEWDIREYISWVPQELIWEQLFTYDAICRLGLEKRLPIYDDIKQLDNVSLAGYWSPNGKEFNDIGERSDVWLADGNIANFNQIKWHRNKNYRNCGFSGRLLKELEKNPTIWQFDNSEYPIEIRDTSDNEYIHWYIIARDYRWQAICEFDGLDWEVFIIDEKNISYKEPDKIEQEIEVNGRKYRLIE